MIQEKIKKTIDEIVEDKNSLNELLLKIQKNIESYLYTISHSKCIEIQKNTITIFAKLTILKFEKYDNVFFNWAKEQFSNCIDYTNYLFVNFKEIQNNLVKACDLKKCLNYDDYTTDHVNEYSSIKNILDIFNNNEIERYRFSNYLECLKNYSLVFDEKNLLINTTEHYELLKNIDNHSISELIFLIKTSKSIIEKENHMSKFAIKMLHFIEKKNWNNKSSDINKKLKEIFNDGFLNKLPKECNGYFRHASNENKTSKESNEWNRFDESKKNDIINKTITYYLAILSILKDEGFELKIS